MKRSENKYDLIVVGGGHAGIEASLIAHKRGIKTLLISMDKKAAERPSYRSSTTQRSNDRNTERTIERPTERSNDRTDGRKCFWTRAITHRNSLAIRDLQNAKKNTLSI